MLTITGKRTCSVTKAVSKTYAINPEIMPGKIQWWLIKNSEHRNFCKALKTLKIPYEEIRLTDERTGAEYVEVRVLGKPRFDAKGNLKLINTKCDACL